MVAAVEVSESGEATFASLRVPAWHGLGTVFSEPVDTKRMLELAHLNDWNIHLEEVKVPHSTHREWFYVVRTNPFDNALNVLGMVGKRYKVVQNEELFDFADGLLKDGRWETAGSINDGATVFGSLALEREVILDPTGAEDRVNTYLLVHTSHDGTTALQASTTPVRVVCQNTLNMALRGAKQTFKVRHTQTVADKMLAAREALGTANQFIDKFESEAKALHAKKVTDKKVFEIFSTLYPKPEKDAKGSVTKWESKIDTLNSIYVGPTNNTIAGTAWGVLNALTERLDWYRTARGGDGSSLAVAASGFNPVINAEKGRILSVVKELAGVTVKA